MYVIEKETIIKLVNEIINYDPKLVNSIITQLVEVGFENGVFGYDSLSADILHLLGYITVVSECIKVKKQQTDNAE